jgi:hypothetical protein
LAYSDHTRFYLRQVEGGETHEVPLPKAFATIAESWFPDSSHLLVSWADDHASGGGNRWRETIQMLVSIHPQTNTIRSPHLQYAWHNKR